MVNYNNNNTSNNTSTNINNTNTKSANIHEQWDTVVSLLQDLYNANEVIPFDYNVGENDNNDTKTKVSLSSSHRQSSSINKQKHLQYKDNCSRGKRIVQEIKANLDNLLVDLEKSSSGLSKYTGVEDIDEQTKGHVRRGDASRHAGFTKINKKNDYSSETSPMQNKRVIRGGEDLEPSKSKSKNRQNKNPAVESLTPLPVDVEDDALNNRSSAATGSGATKKSDTNVGTDSDSFGEIGYSISGRRRRNTGAQASATSGTGTAKGVDSGTTGLKNSQSGRESEKDENKENVGFQETQTPQAEKIASGSTSSKTTQYGKSYYSSEFNPNEPVLLGSQVAYKPSKKSSGITDWFQCEVTKILNSEGTKFEVKDPEPDDFGNPGASYKCTWKEILLLPPHPTIATARKMKPYPVGTKVLAKYPETTTFYPANVIGKNTTKNGLPTCILRFDGEEEVDKETEVERFWVLPFPKKFK